MVTHLTQGAQYCLGAIVHRQGASRDFSVSRPGRPGSGYPVGRGASKPCPDVGAALDDRLRHRT